MYTTNQNPKFENSSLKTLEMRAGQSFASKVGNLDFRRNTKEFPDQPIQNDRQKLTVIARMLDFFLKKRIWRSLKVKKSFV